MDTIYKSRFVSIHVCVIDTHVYAVVKFDKGDGTNKYFLCEFIILLILIWLKLILVLMGSSALVPISQTELWLMWSMVLFILGLLLCLVVMWTYRQ